MKKFLIVGNMNAITYKGVFPLIKDNQLWLGRSWIKEFIQTDGIAKSFGNICWYTNLDHSKRHEPLDLYKKYSSEEYPHYDNYDAIEVGKVTDIPMDYDGAVGVPITFLDKYCPEQFEILGIANSARWIGDFPCFTIINGQKIYNRILIRHSKILIYSSMKKFLIVGNMNAITYKEVFPHIKNNQLWSGVGFNKTMEFSMPDSYERYDRIWDGKKIGKVPAIAWFTNLEHNKRHELLDFYKRYTPEEYPHYDNYDAIEVSKVCDIPMDYDGLMGVPITFLAKWCPEQFEIVGLVSGAKGEGLTTGNDGRAKFYVGGKGVYARILIRKKQ